MQKVMEFDFDPSAVKCAEWRKIDPSYGLSQHPVDAVCPVCGLRARLKCSGCLRVAYCGAQHQRIHWKREHRLGCCPYKIVRGGPDVGRFVVATRDIKAGEVIMEEPPITIGPKQYTAPVCLGCYVPVDAKNRCDRCQWPLCSPACGQMTIHRLECAYLQESVLCFHCLLTK